MPGSRLVILGIGSVRCGAPIIASLATYFGERPIEVRLYDSDLERLDLFDRLTRVCFSVESSKHDLLSFDDPFEALEGAERVIVAIGENCAKRFLKRHDAFGKLKKREAVIEKALERIIPAIPDGAPTLNLMRNVHLDPSATVSELDWPPNLSEDDRRAAPHQILRWIKGDEYLHSLLPRFERSPLKSWLDES